MFGWSSFGKVKFGSEVYEHDIIIDSASNVHERDCSFSQERYKDNHHLCLEEIEAFITPDVEAIVIGSGTAGCIQLEPQVRQLIEEKQLELHLLLTPEAIKRYNEIYKTRKTVAFIHITC